jgi:hypothetical protein
MFSYAFESLCSQDVLLEIIVFFALRRTVDLRIISFVDYQGLGFVASELFQHSLFRVEIFSHGLGC